METGRQEKGKKYSKDRWIELSLFSRALMTMVEPERIPSSSRSQKEGWMALL